VATTRPSTGAKSGTEAASGGRSDSNNLALQIQLLVPKVSVPPRAGSDLSALADVYRIWWLRCGAIGHGRRTLCKVGGDKRV